jgi:hypothetical protein
MAISYLASPRLVPRLVPRDREFTQDRKSSHPQGGYGFGEFTRIHIRMKFEICRKLPRTFHGLGLGARMHVRQTTTSTIGEMQSTDWPSGR